MKGYLILTFVAVCLVFTACSKKNHTTNMSTGSIIDKKWQLVEIGGKPVASTINDKMPFIQFLSTENRYTASAGCNGLGGTYTISDNGRIQFSQGMSTMMACDHMEIETELTKVLQQADNYTVNENRLSLNKGRTSPLAIFKEVSSEDLTLNGTWELDYISGPRIAFEGLFPNKKPSITFNLPNTKASGSGSCNNFNVTFSMEGSNIKFGPPASTRMACPGDGESAFFRTLEKITKFSVNDNTLTFIMDDIAMMRFKKK